MTPIFRMCGFNALTSKLLPGLLLLGLFPSCQEAGTTQIPNIIYILADDLGYGDVSAMNEEAAWKTVHIDRIATEGMVFRDAHTGSAVCTPTRYGILTGRYNWRSTLKRGVLGVYDEPLMDINRTNIATMLKKHGYKTACIGKWHLGRNWPTTDNKPPVNKKGENNVDFKKPISGGPEDLGFDYYFGTDVPNYPPYCFIENQHTVGIPSVYWSEFLYNDCRPGIGLTEWKMDRILPTLQEKAVDYINNSANNEQPFFLYFPLTAPHTPIAPSGDFIGKSDLNVYADFVIEVDNVVGQVLKALEEIGISENTIVVFTSDNGCSPQADFAQLETKGHDPSYVFRGHKADIFEGGHRVPYVVRWPEKVKPGKSEQLICTTDFFATVADMLGEEYPDNVAEDSYSFLSALDLKSKTKTRESIVHHSVNGSFAFRKGDFKVNFCPGSGGWSAPRPNSEGIAKLPQVQLYNIKEDIAEENNIQDKHPEIVEEFRAELTRIVKEGRSTPGAPQKNDGPETWPQLKWIDNN